VPAAAALSEQELLRSPAWLPVEAQAGGLVRLVSLDEAAYRRASFLDQRLLHTEHEQRTCAPALLESAAARLAPRAHYIFHTGHVGSTLMSRLLGEHRDCFALREPALLRALSRAAAGAVAADLATALALLGRTWRPQQRALIKVTSFVSELAVPILAGADHPVALCMYVRPPSYLCGIFAGPNSRAETRQLAPLRLQRLARRLGAGDWRPDPSSEGEHIAMSWLCEMGTLREAAERFPAQVLWVDFDAFLGEPAPALQRILGALGHTMPAGEIGALVSGPLMRQYSKAPEHAYDTALRRTVLLAAQREHAAEIRRGLSWLERVAMQHPLTRAVLA
jgi:hypothetical protein